MDIVTHGITGVLASRALPSGYMGTGQQRSDLVGEIGAVCHAMRWVLVGLVLGGSLWLFLNTVSHVLGPEGLLFWIWHGSW